MYIIVYIYIYCTCYPFLSLGSFGMIPLTNHHLFDTPFWTVWQRRHQRTKRGRPWWSKSLKIRNTSIRRLGFSEISFRLFKKVFPDSHCNAHCPETQCKTLPTISPMTSRCEVVIVYHVYPDSFPLCPHCIPLYHQFCWLNAHCWCWIFIFVGQTRICPWRYHTDLGGTWSSLSLGLGTRLIYLPLCQKANPKNHSHMLITFRKFGSGMAWNLWPHETFSFRGTVMLIWLVVEPPH